MPNRIIKESICTSDSLSELNWFEQALFVRLIVLADDFGTYDARPKVIKGKGFPLDSVTEKQISDGLQHIAQLGMIALYTVSGKPYLQLTSWTDHQQIRAKKSKFPQMHESDSTCNQLISDDIRCNQVQSNVTVIQSNPIQSESESNPNPTTQREVDFEAFWNAYPKKVGKEAARKAFKKAKAPLQTLLEAVAKQKQSDQWKKDNGQYIPNPATWLNQGRWEDEVEAAAKPFQNPWDDPHYYDWPDPKTFGGST